MIGVDPEESIMLVGRPLVSGEAGGELLVSTEPLSFWGGFDADTGEIIDRRHPLSGKYAVDRVLAIPGTRGSSTTTAVLLEAIRQGTAPAALVTSRVDAFLALTAIVAEEMYGKTIPVVAVGTEDFGQLTDGAYARVERDGTVVVSVPPLII